MDKCKFCEARGDIERCQKTECVFHNYWIVKHIKSRIAELEAENAKLLDAIAFRMPVDIE